MLLSRYSFFNNMFCVILTYNKQDIKWLQSYVDHCCFYGCFVGRNYGEYFQKTFQI